MQNFGGQTKSIMVFSEVAYWLSFEMAVNQFVTMGYELLLFFLTKFLVLLLCSIFYNLEKQGIRSRSQFCKSRIVLSETGGGVVVKAQASHQCGPGSIPRLGVICGLSLLVLFSAPTGFPLFSKTYIW